MAVKAYTLEQTGPQVQQAIDKSLNLSNATQSTDGLMSKQDKQKLDSLDNELAGKVDKVQGKGLSTNDFTDEEKSKTDSAYQKPVDGIPASDLAEGVIPDTSQFITKTVNDLANYYLKTETYAKNEVYNKSEVEALIALIKQFAYQVVSELPEASEVTMFKIYLVPSADPQTQNIKDEYITIRSGSEGAYMYSWEQIGSTAIDLSGYVTTTDLNTALEAYTTTANLTTLLAAKQDVIQDLQTIRTGATAGATAYQKPSGGVPESDLASTVQTSLGKADTAIQSAEFNELKDEVDTIGNGAYEEAWDGDSTPVVADIPAGVVVTYSSVSYTGTLVASASTVDKIYLVSDGNGNYDRYVTVENSGTYSWKKVGTTAIPLSDYATRAELSQLDLNVDEEINGETIYTPYDESFIKRIDGARILDAGSDETSVKFSTSSTASLLFYEIVPDKKYTIKTQGTSLQNGMWAYVDSVPNTITGDTVVSGKYDGTHGLERISTDIFAENHPYLVISCATENVGASFVQLVGYDESVSGGIKNEVRALQRTVGEGGDFEKVAEKSGSFPGTQFGSIIVPISLVIGDRIIVKVTVDGTTDFTMQGVKLDDSSYNILTMTHIQASGEFFYETPYDLKAIQAIKPLDVASNADITIEIDKYITPTKLCKKVADLEENTGRVFRVGSTREYTTLRAGVSEAIKYKNSIVYVDAEEFDLCQEFATEITAAGTSQYGIGLGNGVHIIFSPGAKVKALYGGQNANVVTYFAPFYTMQIEGGFTLENLDIDASNCRYCVHDEYAGYGGFTHSRYINCRMSFDNTDAATQDFPQCIGGGCAKHSYVEIINCTFTNKKSESEVTPLVSYHNTNAHLDAMSRIVVSNSYFANYGTFRVYYWGDSTNVSTALLNNNSFGAEPQVRPVSENDTTVNFAIEQFMNEVRS